MRSNFVELWANLSAAFSPALANLTSTTSPDIPAMEVLNPDSVWRQNSAHATTGARVRPQCIPLPGQCDDTLMRLHRLVRSLLLELITLYDRILVVNIIRGDINMCLYNLNLTYENNFPINLFRVLYDFYSLVIHLHHA